MGSINNEPVLVQWYNGLAPNSRQAIVWTNDGLVYWRMYAYPANTSRDNDVVITSQRRHFDVITSKWRRFDVITTSLLRHVFSG